MATMYPRTLLRDDVKSDAEVAVFERLEAELDDSWEVFHSVAWIHRDPATGAGEGEVDFVIAHPEVGILCLEVKGGELECRHGEWHRIVGGRPERAKDPFQQATDHKHAIRRLVEGVDGWKRERLLIVHAVALPDISKHSLLLPPTDAPPELILDHRDVKEDLPGSIDRVFAFHTGIRETRRAPGAEGMTMLRDLLAPTVELRTPLAAAFGAEEEALVQLTRDQAIALRELGKFPRVALSGCAGSGKTLLAVEHARRLAAQGKRLLFVCFNRPLAMHLKETAGGEGIDFWNFHSLCVRYCALAGIDLPKGTDQPPEYWNDELPEHLLDAFAELGPQWDALIVDEAQDLHAHWFDVLLAGMQDEREAPVWLFHDDNQRIYDSTFEVPDGFLDWSLHTNCRTTQAIHRELLKLHSSPVEPDARGPEGRPPELHQTADGAGKVAELLDRLTTTDGVRPDEIAVLSAHGASSRLRTALGKRLWHTSDKGRRAADAVRFSSIRAFKGLEARVVVLCELDGLDVDTRDQQLYVGLSRARNHCLIVAPPAAA